MTKAINSVPTISAQAYLVPFDPALLAQMSIRELVALYKSLSMVADLVAATLCQPRMFADKERVGYNAAGQVMDRFCDSIDRTRKQIIEAAARLAPTEQDEANERAFLLLEHECSLAEDLQAFVAVASIAATMSSPVASELVRTFIDSFATGNAA